MVRRGFKSWCEKTALEKRSELALRPTDPLSPWGLAEHVRALVWYPSDVPDVTDELLKCLGRSPSEWSAATVVHPMHTLVILNEAHQRPRQAHDLMHELSHLICGHKPGEALSVDAHPFLVADYDTEQEEEADLLAGALLLPRVALVQIEKAGLALSDAARRYGVSEELVEMRMHRTGVYRQFSQRLR